MQHGGIVVGSFPNGIQVAIQSRSRQTRPVQILRGAHKCSGLSHYSRAQSAEISAGFGRKKEQELLGILRNGKNKPLFAYLPVPSFDFSEPVWRRRIGGPTKKRRHHDVAHGLLFRHVGMNPDAISGLQVRDLGDRQCLTCSSYAHLDLRSGQIERHRAGWRARRRKHQEQGRTQTLPPKRRGDVSGYAPPKFVFTRTIRTESATFGSWGLPAYQVYIPFRGWKSLTTGMIWIGALPPRKKEETDSLFNRLKCFDTVQVSLLEAKMGGVNRVRSWLQSVALGVDRIFERRPNTRPRLI